MIISSSTPLSLWKSSSLLLKGRRGDPFKIRRLGLQGTSGRGRPPPSGRAEKRCAVAMCSAEKMEEELGLQKEIADFFDKDSWNFEDMWGAHMHHGFYDRKPTSNADHRYAQIRMIEEAIRFAGISEDPKERPQNIVDVGCGLGGGSIYLAKKFGARCQGIDLSPGQIQRATALAVAQGLADRVSFQVADALDQPFADGQFDLVWAMESAEHMPDKRKFVSELVRVASPGSTILMTTWCHRDPFPSEESLQQGEIELLNKMCDALHVSALCSTADYVQLLESLSLQGIRVADWSQYVAPFWPAVISSMLTWKGLITIARNGWKHIKVAFTMPLIVEGYKKGLLKTAIITCRKAR